MYLQFVLVCTLTSDLYNDLNIDKWNITNKYYLSKIMDLIYQ